jgi:hypothetical protein
MANQTQLQILPAPPRYTGQDTQDYRDQLNRWLANLYTYVTSVNYLRGNGLFLPGLPTTGYGLKPDEVFSNGGVLTIVRAGDIWAGGFAVSCAVGSVTVTP